MDSGELGVGDADCDKADEEGWGASCGGWVGDAGKRGEVEPDEMSMGEENIDSNAVESDGDGEVAASA